MPTPTKYRETNCSNVCGLCLLIAIAVLLATAAAAAQSLWERAALNLAATFTGPLARSLSLVAIVIGGLKFMFGETGDNRQIYSIVISVGMVLFESKILTWLF